MTQIWWNFEGYKVGTKTQKTETWARWGRVDLVQHGCGDGKRIFLESWMLVCCVLLMRFTNLSYNYLRSGSVVKSRAKIGAGKLSGGSLSTDSFSNSALLVNHQQNEAKIMHPNCQAVTCQLTFLTSKSNPRKTLQNT